MAENTPNLLLLLCRVLFKKIYVSRERNKKTSLSTWENISYYPTGEFSNLIREKEKA